MKKPITALCLLLVILGCGNERDLSPTLPPPDSNEESLSVSAIESRNQFDLVVSQEIKARGTYRAGNQVSTENYSLTSIGFTAAQKKKLEDAYQHIINQFVQHHTQTVGGGKSDFMKCVEARNPTELQPVGKKLNGDAGKMASLALSYWRYLARDKKGIIKAMTLNHVSGRLTAASAFVIKDGNIHASNLDMRINMVFLNDSRFGTRQIANAIFHEGMHRLGWTHPFTFDHAHDNHIKHFINVMGDCMETAGTSAQPQLRKMALNGDSIQL